MIPQQENPDVPAKVFAQFLADAATQGISNDVIERLRTTLITEKQFDDEALKQALFTEPETLK